jgi:hypothetical protein
LAGAALLLCFAVLGLYSRRDLDEIQWIIIKSWSDNSIVIYPSQTHSCDAQLRIQVLLGLTTPPSGKFPRTRWLARCLQLQL